MKKLLTAFSKWIARRRFERCKRQASGIVARTKARWPNSDGVMCAWPPTTGASPQGTIATGHVRTGEASYFKWGTHETLTVLNGQTVTGFIVVERIRQHRKKDNKEYKNGSGVQSGRVQVFHGVVWEATVRDNAQLSGIPNEGTAGTLVDMAGHLGTPGLTYSTYVLDSDYEGEPGEPGKRSMLFERIKLIEG